MRLPLRVLALAAAAVGSAWIASRLTARGPSDAEVIRELLAAGARSAEEGRATEAVQALSRRFDGEGPGPLDREGVARLIALESRRDATTLMAVTGSAVAVDGEGARAVSDLVLARGKAGKPLEALAPGEASAWRVTCELQREEGAWRVVKARWRQVALPEAIAGEAQRQAELTAPR